VKIIGNSWVNHSQDLSVLFFGQSKPFYLYVPEDEFKEKGGMHAQTASWGIFKN
jgi:hypothetical protein